MDQPVRRGSGPRPIKTGGLQLFTLGEPESSELVLRHTVPVFPYHVADHVLAAARGQAQTEDRIPYSGLGNAECECPLPARLESPTESEPVATEIKTPNSHPSTSPYSSHR